MKTFEKDVLKRLFQRLRARFEGICKNVRKRRFETRFKDVSESVRKRCFETRF